MSKERRESKISVVRLTYEWQNEDFEKWDLTILERSCKGRFHQTLYAKQNNVTAQWSAKKFTNNLASIQTPNYESNFVPSLPNPLAISQICAPKTIYFCLPAKICQKTQENLLAIWTKV